MKKNFNSVKKIHFFLFYFKVQTQLFLIKIKYEINLILSSKWLAVKNKSAQ